MRDAREDWRRYDPTAIPGKEATPLLDDLLADVLGDASTRRPPSLLDVGCGTGRLAKRLFETGFSVTGVDINPEAIRIANASAVADDGSGRSLRFRVADCASKGPVAIEPGAFDVVVCQLVLSIVGGEASRVTLLRHLREALGPAGRLYLSASGVSDAINAGYARLYAEDFPLTGERHSYLSRDAAGRALYMTHHFTADEVADLLRRAGFARIDVTTVAEASSRRPDEAAYFHYATCRAG